MKNFGVTTDGTHTVDLDCYGALRDVGRAPKIVDDQHVIKCHSKNAKKLQCQLDAVCWLREHGGISFLPRYVKTIFGERFLQDEEGYCWTLSEYVSSGVVVHREKATIGQHRALGKVAADIQIALSSLKPLLSTTVPFDTCPPYLSRTEILVGAKLRFEMLLENKDLSLQEGRGALFIKSIQKCISRLQATLPLCPRTLFIHNDLAFQNVKFATEDSTDICLVVDFDISQVDYRVAEFNNMVFARPGHLPLILNQKNIDALMEGYRDSLLSSSDPLSDVEQSAIIEILRSRVLEEVARHQLREYVPFVLNCGDFDEQTEQRWTILKEFEEMYP